MEQPVPLAMKPIFFALAALMFCLTGYKNLSVQGDKPPTLEEVRQYFYKDAKANADFYHHTNVKVVFSNYKQAAPAPYKFSVGTKICYAVKIDWTSSNDFEGTTYLATYTNDLYRFYRNEFGELEVGNHVPGNLVSTTHPVN